MGFFLGGGAGGELGGGHCSILFVLHLRAYEIAKASVKS